LSFSFYFGIIKREGSFIMELIEVLDDNGNKIGVVKEKDIIKEDGDFYRAIAVMIVNSDGEILFTKRSKDKKMYPELWSMFITGHVKAFEASIDAASREIQEEVGIDVSNKELNYLYTIKDEKRNNSHIENIFFDNYILYKDIDINDIKVNEEIEGVQFVSIDDAKYLVDNRSEMIVPNDLEYEKIFDYIKNKKNKSLLKTK